MIIEKIGEDQRSKLRLSLIKLCQQRRGVSFVVTTESEKVGNIQLTVTGKNGSSVKNIIVTFNEATSEWEVYSDGYVYKMSVISDITTVLKQKVSKLSAILSKI